MLASDGDRMHSACNLLLEVRCTLRATASAEVKRTLRALASRESDEAFPRLPASSPGPETPPLR